MFSRPATAVLMVSDLEKQTAFYTRVIGLEVTCRRPGWVEFEAVRVALEQSGGERGNRSAIALAVEDVAEAHRLLIARGALEIASPVANGSGIHARVQDPEGNIIVLREARRLDTVTAATLLNDVIHREPEAMGVLEAHGIRLCGGCLVLLNSSLEDVAAYSGLSAKQSAELVSEMNHVLSNRR